MPLYLKEKLNEDHLYLVNLLEQCPYEIEYAPKKLQSKGSSTCGRWCALRIKFDKINIDEFVDVFFEFKPYSPDEICVVLSNSLL